MSQVKHKVVVLSGKGGVGKSTVAANLAAALAETERKVGLLDADIHGPSAPRIFNLEDQGATSDGESIVPVPYEDNLKIMSIGFLLEARNDAVIWRGPLKMNVLRQFLSDVNWGELDFLVVDLPPGTGDEPLSIGQLIPDADGGIVVTTPQGLALNDVRKCINFCKQIELPVIGVVENMSGFICPHCGEKSDIFGTGGGETMAEEMDVPFLARIPIDPAVVLSCEGEGPHVQIHPDSATTKAFQPVVDMVLDLESSN
ncbi:MAG: Mrp/NBP35 family ATP-binding protein [Planctomycetes bacterium]|nr:Mrp/NBP35 family ATP-binding protein [Planctomycetota bacterium]